MKITGEMLKSERINKGLTVQQVSQALKLTSKIVTSIEAGDVANLPAKTFVRGFVKSYAEYLKLNSDVVMRQFQEEVGTTSPLPKVPPPSAGETPQSFKSKKPDLRHTSQNYSPDKSVTSTSIKKQHLAEQNINNKIMLFLLGAVVLVVLIISGNRIFDSEPPTPTPELESANIVIPSYDSNDPVASATTTSTDVENINTATSPTVVAATTSGTAATTTTAAAVEEEIAPSAGKPVEIILEPKKEIEIFYAKGNTKVFKMLKLYPNKTQVLRSPSGLHIKASDGGAFKVIANGVEVGNAGANNKPVKLSF